MHGNKVRSLSRQADWDQILRNIVRHFPGHQRWIDCDGPDGVVQKCVAVGGGFGNAICANVAGCTDNVFDHNGLAPKFRELLTK